MLNFIKDVLTNRTFQVKINGNLSTCNIQSNGIPQGSTLSITLFLIAINDVREAINFPVKVTLFADDLNLLCKGKNTNSVQIALQDTINSITKWPARTGFILYLGKSHCTIFTKQKIHNKLNLLLNNIPLYKKKTAKILGIIFDCKDSTSFQSNHYFK